MSQSWYQARAEIRVTKVTFDFSRNAFRVEGMIDLLGEGGGEHIISKTFAHEFFDFDPAIDQLKSILKNKCGEDLFGKK